MKFPLPLLTLFLLSCNPEKHDIDKGIEEMAEYREEMPVEDTVREDCTFDTSYYKLTLDALRGLPDVKDIRWIESEHTAVANWRGDEVRRSRGGCERFADNLILITRQGPDLRDALYWLEKAKQVTTHFGIPYFAQAIAQKKVKLDPTMSDAETDFYRLEIEPPEDRVVEGFSIQQISGTTTLRFEQYQH